MSVKILETNGKPAFAVLPYDEYQQLRELADDADDVSALARFAKRYSKGAEEASERNSRSPSRRRIAVTCVARTPWFDCRATRRGSQNNARTRFQTRIPQRGSVAGGSAQIGEGARHRTRLACRAKWRIEPLPGQCITAAASKGNVGVEFAIRSSA